MATGVGWQQQQQQQQHCSGGPAAGKVGSAPEYNHELHIKMSKKIAQLTKVLSSSTAEELSPVHYTSSLLSIQGPKQSFQVRQRIACTSSNLINCILCS
ncbi:protein FAM184A-like [Leucoraja erinacea]|uniref:protein FAM184A-like n=1 Tax=Leucoraja erinaceus TaxID=7782 RepID=UPI0024590E8D|nr:protein FAM184A-like [Leucoraja erinacea]